MKKNNKNGKSQQKLAKHQRQHRIRNDFKKLNIQDIKQER